MTSETRLAFEHPEARASATAGPSDPLDRISLRDYVVEVEIGAFQQERGTTQQICFNVVVEVQPVAGPIDDDVDRILSYDRITEAIDAELSAERLNLLETLAERVADRVLQEPQAQRVFVRIEKLERGPGALGVEIVRAKIDAVIHPTASADAGTVPKPAIVFLSNTAIWHPGVSDLLDRLCAAHPEVILCVGPPEAPAPQSDVAPAQRRIDLLAIEQNAWVLAGRDARCVVRGTRTELDWALRNGQVSVWAPSKIVLDAVEGPEGADPMALALWFAEEMGATCLLTAGCPAPKPRPGASIDCREVALG